LHKEFVIKSAQAKKHIFCEEPFALTVKDAEEMIKEVAREKVKLMIGMVLRFWPEYIEFKRRVTPEDAKTSLEIVLQEIKSAEIGKEILL